MKDSYVFQVDSELVNSVYSAHDNYLIENSSGIDTGQLKYCAVYFSSNNLYYPNTAEEFNNAIVDKNRFEWYGTRIEKASKHIFLRDLYKQWYLKGVNAQINHPDKLLGFLKQETEGFEIVTLGSSSGGFAAVFYGQLLGAETIYSFNGQFEVDSLLKKSSKEIDPILFRNQNDTSLRAYYDISKFIKEPSKILYFRSNKSDWDVEQYTHIKDLGLNTFSFNTNHHGIPFAKTALPKVLNMTLDSISNFKGKKINPIVFSFQIAGIKQTMKAVWAIIRKLLKRIGL